MATSGYFYMATNGDFLMAMDTDCGLYAADGLDCEVASLGRHTRDDLGNLGTSGLAQLCRDCGEVHNYGASNRRSGCLEEKTQ